MYAWDARKYSKEGVEINGGGVGDEPPEIHSQMYQYGNICRDIEAMRCN